MTKQVPTVQPVIRQTQSRHDTSQRSLWVGWLLGVILVSCPTGCTRNAATTTAKTATATSSVLPSDEELKQRIDHALDLVYAYRRLNVRDHAAWQIVHGAVAFGLEFPMESDGKIVSAIDYLLAGGQMRGWNLEAGDTFGERRGLRAIVESGSNTGQGHYDQWLGYLSGCNLPVDQPIQLGGTTYLLSDLISQVEWDAPRNLDQEFSWTLMGLTKYHPTSYEWTASDGQRWNIAKLVEIEAQHDLNTSACGGAHRLCGLVLALQRHVASGGMVAGSWELAEDKIHAALSTAREYQNSDGSLSSNYLRRPGRSADLADNLGATGHVLEFVVLAKPDSELRADWIKRAAMFLCDVIERTKDVPLECGALYHASSGLVIYRERLFGKREFSLAALQQSQP